MPQMPHIANPGGGDEGETTISIVSPMISRYSRSERSAMYSKSWASFSAHVISRVSRSWAKPVIPGRTTRRCQ